MARPRKFDEDKVLLSALETFWQEGYDATTYRELEKRTGVGLRSLNNTFGEKDALFARALKTYREMAEDSVKQAFKVPGILGLIGFFEALPVTNSDAGENAPSGCLMVNSMMEIRDPSPAAAKEISAFREMFKRLFRDALIADKVPDAEARADYLVCALWGIFIHMRMTGEKASSAPMVRVVVETMQGWAARQ